MSAGALQRLRSSMEAEALTRAYLSRPVSIAYLTGFRTDPHERTMALVVTIVVETWGGRVLTSAGHPLRVVAL